MDTYALGSFDFPDTCSGSADMLQECRQDVVMFRELRTMTSLFKHFLGLDHLSEILGGRGELCRICVCGRMR